MLSVELRLVGRQSCSLSLLAAGNGWRSLLAALFRQALRPCSFGEVKLSFQRIYPCFLLIQLILQLMEGIFPEVQSINVSCAICREFRALPSLDMGAKFCEIVCEKSASPGWAFVAREFSYPALKPLGL